jgi:competence protein ComEA
LIAHAIVIGMSAVFAANEPGKCSQENFMHSHIIKGALIAAALAFSATPSVAADNKSGASAEPVNKAKTVEKGAKAKTKTLAPSKLVDINHANKAGLKQLPGIGDTEADKIVAGRPYLSKADLVTRNILPRGTYEGLKKLIIAKQK